MRFFPISTLLLAFTILCANSAHADHHLSNPKKELAKEVGTWDAETKFWVSPGTDPLLGKAVEENTMFGDNWILSSYKSEGGMKFEGRGQHGYDPVGKEYVGTWIDTMSPYLSVMKGKVDESTGVLTMISTSRDPQTGEINHMKMVSSFSDDNHKKFEMLAPIPGEKDKWWKMMEINYTRRQ